MNEELNMSLKLSTITKEARKRIKIKKEQDFFILLNEKWPLMKEKSASEGSYEYNFSKDFPDIYEKIKQRFLVGKDMNYYRSKIMEKFLKERGLILQSKILGIITWKRNCLDCILL